MAKRRRYERAIKLGGDDSLSKVAGLVAPGSTVLDLGIGSGDLGRFLTQERGCTVDGVESDSGFIQQSAPYYRRIFQANLDHCDWRSGIQEGNYDVVVCADVLEHIINVERVLSDIRSLLKNDGRTILSIPNVAYAGLVLELLDGRFHYRNEGILDRTHVHFYTKESLYELLAGAGYHIADIDTVDIPIHRSEFKNYSIENIPPELAHAISRRKDALIYQYIITASAGDAVGCDTRSCVEDRVASRSIRNQFFHKIYWMSDSDLHYAERNSQAQFVQLSDEAITINYLIEGDAPIRYIRLSPSDRTGYVDLNHLVFTDVDNERRFELVGHWETHCSNCQMLGLLIGPAEGGHLAVLVQERGAWLEVNLEGLFSDGLPRRCQLEISQSRPWSQDYLALREASKGLMAEQKRLMQEAIKNRAELISLRGDLKRTRQHLAELQIQNRQLQDQQDPHLQQPEATRCPKLGGLGRLGTRLKKYFP